MGRFIVGLIIGALLVPLGVVVYFETGMAPVATSAQAMPFEKTFARIGLSKRLDKEAPKSSPIQPSDAVYAAGADVYRENCAACHGLRNQPHPPTFARGMYPRPPQLLRGKGVTDDPPGETYWKVANGIRLTGMPAFRQSLSDDQMWQVSLLLANADKLPASVDQALAVGAEPTAPPPGK